MALDMRVDALLEERAHAHDLAERVQRALESLTEQERRVIVLRFGLEAAGAHAEHNGVQIAHLMGMSRQRVCQRAARALSKLRGRADLAALVHQQKGTESYDHRFATASLGLPTRTRRRAQGANAV